MTPEHIAEIEARISETTHGPWLQVINSDGEIVLSIPDGHDVIFGDMEGACGECLGNCAFLAHARTDVPELILEIHKLNNELSAALLKINELRALTK